MGRTLMVCGLIMAVVIALVGWLQPGSFIMWFAASDGQLAIVRWIIVGVLAALLVTDIFTDYRPLRWGAGVLSLVLAYDASRILVDHSVYMLDFLIVAMAATCSAIVALQPRASEQRALPDTPLLVERTTPLQGAVVGLFERLARPLRHGQRAVPNLMKAGRDQDIEDNRHRLTISYRT